MENTKKENDCSSCSSNNCDKTKCSTCNKKKIVKLPCNSLSSIKHVIGIVSGKVVSVNHRLRP